MPFSNRFSKRLQHFKTNVREYGVLLHEGGHAVIGDNHPQYGCIAMCKGIGGQTIAKGTWAIIEGVVKKQMAVWK